MLGMELALVHNPEGIAGCHFSISHCVSSKKHKDTKQSVIRSQSLSPPGLFVIVDLSYHVKGCHLRSDQLGIEVP